MTTFNFCVLMNEIYRNFEIIIMFYETIGIIHTASLKKGSINLFVYPLVELIHEQKTKDEEQFFIVMYYYLDDK